MFLLNLLTLCTGTEYRKFRENLPLPLTEDVSFSFQWKDFLVSILKDPEKVIVRRRRRIEEVKFPEGALLVSTGHLIAFEPVSGSFYVPPSFVYPSKETKLIFLQERGEEVYIVSVVAEPPSRDILKKIAEEPSSISGPGGKSTLWLFGRKLFAQREKVGGVDLPIRKEEVRIIGHPLSGKGEYDVLVMATRRRHRGRKNLSFKEKFRFNGSIITYFLVFVQRRGSEWSVLPLVRTTEEPDRKTKGVTYVISPTPDILDLSFCIVSEKTVVAVHEIDKGNRGFRLLTDAEKVLFGIRCLGEKLRPAQYEETTIFMGDRNVREFLGIGEGYPKGYSPHGIFVSCGSLRLDEYLSLARDHTLGFSEADFLARIEGEDITFAGVNSIKLGEGIAYKSYQTANRYPTTTATEDMVEDILDHIFKGRVGGNLFGRVLREIREKDCCGMIIDTRTGEIRKREPNIELLGI